MIPSWAHDAKPEKIMRQICKICLSDGRVLDPFAGSGSTLAAAEREGYAWESRTLSLSDKGQAILTKKHVDDTIDPF